MAASFAAWGAVQLLIVLCTVAFRWALKDQRARCPVCLRVLTKPVRVGVGSSGFLGWNGIEMMCCMGHGLLYLPESPSDHFHDPRWVTLDSSWRVLFDSPAADNTSLVTALATVQGDKERSTAKKSTDWCRPRLRTNGETCAVSIGCTNERFCNEPATFPTAGF